MKKKEQEQEQIVANSSDKPTVWNLILVLVRSQGLDKRDPEELHTVDEILQRLRRWLCVCVCVCPCVCARVCASFSVCVHNFVARWLKSL